jgi:hypothetical protein
MYVKVIYDDANLSFEEETMDKRESARTVLVVIVVGMMAVLLMLPTWLLRP